MSGSGSQVADADGPLGAVLEVIDEIDRGLAAVQRDEVIVERAGVGALILVALVLGGGALVVLATVLLRKWIKAPAPERVGEQPEWGSSPSLRDETIPDAAEGGDAGVSDRPGAPRG
ncbi:MAG: hypothetical protein ACLQPH_11070 [Acidimicrobiales bacterium]